MPSVRPYVLFVVVAGFIQAVQIFDQAYVIASNGAILGSPAGATATLVIFLYQQVKGAKCGSRHETQFASGTHSTKKRFWDR